MATVEIEGPNSGWVASIGYDDEGEIRVVDRREGWENEAEQLLSRTLLEPTPTGRIPAAGLRAWDEELLYELADSLARRRPVVRGERLTAHVSGGSRRREPGDV